jgi:hypothetical protein
MKAPTCIKDVQKLTGSMAALNRFISKLGERGQPFFKLLKHQEKFVWTPEADQALAQLKDFLSKPPVLTAPCKKQQLLLYLAATTVPPWLSSGKKTATPTQFSDQSTSSARFCRNLKHATNQYRSYCVQCSSPRGSYDTTFRSTRSPSSLTTRSVTSYGTKMLLEESLSGQSNTTPLTSTSSHEQPSSCKH